MEILLNEDSLNGQFHDLNEFCDTLPDMSRNLKFLSGLGVVVLKHSSLYDSKITADLTIRDLQNDKGIVSAQDRDKVRRWKSLMFSMTDTPPFWDLQAQEDDEKDFECIWEGKNVGEKSLGEAARRDTNMLSFQHELFSDVKLEVLLQGRGKEVISFVTTKYLADFYYTIGALNVILYLQMQYSTGRLNAQKIESKKGSVEKLQKDEIAELLEALKRFETAQSWNEIVHNNRYFNYKKYQPSSKAVDWFAQSEYKDKQIDKFRCGEHSRIRCFGYREGEQFILLRVERDHSISDNG